MQNDDTFPFEVAYDHLAHQILRAWPETGAKTEIAPQVLLVMLDDSATAVEVAAPLSWPVDMLFGSSGGKRLLGQMIGEAIDILPHDGCLALVSEAWVKVIKDRADADLTTSLADDPQAAEAVSLFLYRPGQTCLGNLPIGPGRSLSYAPLQRGNGWDGPLAMHPDAQGKA